MISFQDSWDLELDSTSTDLRRHPGPYNGISLFEYRGNVGVLAEMTENGGIRFRMILVHDSGDDEWTEAIADISAVTGEKLWENLNYCFSITH